MRFFFSLYNRSKTTHAHIQTSKRSNLVKKKEKVREATPFLKTRARKKKKELSSKQQQQQKQEEKEKIHFELSQ